MVKNVIIGVLAIGLIFMTVFASLKATEAERQRVLAEEAQAAAVMQEEMAIRQAAIARAAEAEALREKELAEQQRILAQEALEKCKNN